MHFSIFTPFGQLRFSGRKPHGQVIYEERMRNLGDGEVLNNDFGSLVSAQHFAAAMVIAECRSEVERAGNEFRPDFCTETIPEFERQYGIIPTRFANVATRRRDIAEFGRLSRGARYEHVVAKLAAIIGSGLLGYYQISKEDAVQTTLSVESFSNFVKPGTPPVVFRTLTPIAVTASPISVAIEIVNGTEIGLKAGMNFWIDGGHFDRAERATIASVSPGSITATFGSAHDTGVYATTGRAPAHGSNKRTNFILVTTDVARNPELRRKINNAMRKVLRGPSIWNIVEEETPGSGSSGPFVIGSSEIGFHPIQEIP